MKNLINKLKSMNLKRFAIVLLAIFLAIVAALTVSSRVLNDKANEKTMSCTDGSCAVSPRISAATGDSESSVLKSDEEHSEEDIEVALNEAEVSYDKVGNIYIIDNDTVEDADTAETLASLGLEKDIVFNTMADEDGSDAVTSDVSVDTKDSTGLSIKEYSEQSGKKIVAIIDTGVNGYAFESQDFTGEGLSDENGHGTKVAKAVYDSADGNVVILSLKAMSKDGTGYATNIIKALQYAENAGADIINMSIAAEDVGDNSIFKAAVQNALDSGITIVAAAGNYNSSSELYIPANIEGVIVAGAMDADGNKTDKSNYGGVDYYQKAESTSEAAAMVAGKIAAGKDLSEETTQETIKYDRENVGNSFYKTISTSKEIAADGTTTLTTDFSVNYSKEALEEIVSYPNTTVVFTTDYDMSEKVGYGHSIYDSTYNIYHTVFDSEEDSERASEWFDENGVGDVRLINNSVFEIQTTANDTTNNGYYRLTVTASGSGSVTVHGTLTSLANYAYFRRTGTASFWAGTGSASTVKNGNNDGTGKTNTNNYFICGTTTGSDWVSSVVADLGTHAIASGSNCGNINFGVTFKTDATTSRYNLNTHPISASGTHNQGACAPDSNTLTCDPTGGTLVGGNFGSNNGTTNITSVQVRRNTQDYSQLGTAKRTGYEFLGWGSAKQSNDQITKGEIAGEKVMGSNGKCINPTINSSFYENSYWIKNANATIYAQWKSITYTMTINPAGGQHYGEENNSSVNPGGWTSGNTTYKVTYASNAFSSIGGSRRTGYTFLGYAESQQSAAQMKSGTVASTLQFGSNAKAIANTTLWNDSTCWQKLGNATLYSQWKVNTSTIKLNTVGGTASKTSYTAYYGYTDGNTVAVPVKQGFIFQGYYYEKTKQVYDANGKYVSGDYWDNSGNWKKTDANATVTLEAKWTPTSYSVTYNNNESYHVRAGTSASATAAKNRVGLGVNGTMSSSSGMQYGNSFTLSGNAYSWNGHTFLGWALSPTATTAKYSNGQTLSSIVTDAGYSWTGTAWLKDGKTTTTPNITLYAIWKADSHTVTINPTSVASDAYNEQVWTGAWNGSSSATSQTVYWGDAVSLGKATTDITKTITYVKNGDDVTIDRESDTVSLLFNRWNDTDSGKGTIGALNNDKITGNGTNSATLIVGAGSAQTTLIARYYFQSVTLPTPMKEGSNFMGWYYDSAFTQKATGRNGGKGRGGDTFQTIGDVTLYARWEKTTFGYAETTQVFMQDETPDHPDVYMYKENGLTGTVLTTVTDALTGKKVGFTIELYKDSVSASNLVLTLKTDQGVFDASGNKLIDFQMEGVYKITDYLTAGTTYVAHEVSVPRGWSSAKDKTYPYDGKNNLKITLIDKPNKPESTEVFVKKDVYGRPISNTVFELKDETTGETIRSFVTSENGGFPTELASDGKTTLTLFDYCIAGHKYSLTETEWPDGYEKVDTIYFTIPEYSGETINPIYVDEPTETAGALQIVKVNSDDEPLQGAVFQLFVKNNDGELIPCYQDADGNWVSATEDDEKVKNGTYTLMTATTGNDGVASFKKLPLRANYTGSEEDFTKSYYVKEVQAPAGYSILTEEFEIRLPESAKDNTVTYTVKDESIVLTLEAGGKGYGLYGTGATMLAVAFFLVIKKKKQAKAS